MFGLCVCVLYRNPNCQTNLGEIRHKHTRLTAERFLAGFQPRTPTPGVGGAPMGPGMLSTCVFWEGGSYFGTLNPDQEGTGPLEPWSIIFNQSL